MQEFAFDEVFNGGKFGLTNARAVVAGHHFKIRFNVGDHPADQVGFDIGGQTLARHFDGTIMLRVFDDAGNLIHEKEDYALGFINDADYPPSAGKRFPQFVNDPDKMQEVARNPESIWFKPGQRYTLEVERINPEHYGNQPITLNVRARGVDTDKVLASAPASVISKTITIDGVAGTWIPD